VAGFLHLQQGAEVGGSQIPPLVREIEDSEEDSLGEPVLVSASP
jgi:dimethylsulfone monooxygenase